jgi:ribonuclease T2
VKRCSSLLFLLLLALVACRSASVPDPSPGPSRSAQPNTGAAAPFDFYLLNLSWSPEFCHSHPSAPECAQHAAFVLHGLWPQYDNGDYPHNCSTAPGPSDPSAYSDIYPDPSLLQHEWKTHGTCSGLSPDAYFSAARKAFHSVTIPTRLAGLQSQLLMPPNQVLALFSEANPQIPRSAMALSCGNNYLTAMEVCLDKNLLPQACSAVRSCRANIVRIPPP